MALRQVGGALGVAVLGSVLSAAYRDALPAGAPAAARDSVAAAATVAARLHDAALLGAAQTAYVHAMDLVLALCAAVALGAAGLVAAYLPARPGPSGRERQEEESQHEPVSTGSA